MSSSIVDMAANPETSGSNIKGVGMFCDRSATRKAVVEESFVDI